ncbi:hypothetical protein TNCV_3736861 [Trichonephila clavipes]|nr:hypothetical protein TNCV_3736861 [Trichonephila clavipes]
MIFGEQFDIEELLVDEALNDDDIFGKFRRPHRNFDPAQPRLTPEESSDPTGKMRKRDVLNLHGHLGSGNEGKREIVLNRRPELYRGKYRCVQPKINLLKRRSYACETQCFPVEPSGCRRDAFT